ncbi:putative ABC transport system permease protein [Marinospirillum celere]|uniref:Putative ABC transport system permease protein n=1 Tax=Marinospirillum celere TaxID=1122252 RepID=A0A1I1EC37_9GAMM|nr:ABC transporter permease [Marinospirillum celere]SFB82540.1 putative ABC transport system permease protein [Marinospirillum celere]
MKLFYWTLISLLSHWKRHPVQLASLLLGLWLATALWTGVQSLNQQAKSNYDQAASLFDQQAGVYLQAPGGQAFDQALWLELRLQDWPLVPLLEGRIRIQEPEVRLQLLGLDPISQMQLEGTASQILGRTSLEQWITAPGQTLIAPSTMQELGWQPGQRPLTTQGQKLPPLVSLEGLAPGLLLTDIGWAQELLHSPDQLTRLLAPQQWLAPYSGQLPQLPEAIEEQLIWQQGEAEADLGRLTESFHLNLTALGLLAFAVGLFIVHATLGLALEQRLGLLRTLRASGITLNSLLLALLVELGSLALVGGLAGVISGYWLAAALLPDVAASLRSLYGAPVSGQLEMQPTTWLTALLMSFGGLLLAGSSWLFKAARLPILALARPQAWYQAEQRRVRLQGVLALVAALVAAWAWLQGDSLVWGLLLLAGLLLSAALWLPLLLLGLLKLANLLARGPLQQWFWADIRQQLPGLSLALMALLLAQAANIGVGTMTEGFRKTFTGWLDQRLAAEIYIRPETQQQAEEITRWLEQQEAIEAILPQYQIQLEIEGWPVEVGGLVDAATYRDSWPLLQTLNQPWQAVFSENAWLASEQLAQRLQLQPGDQLELTTRLGIRTGKLAGIYADYGNPRGQLLINAEEFLTFWPDQPIHSLALRLAEDQASAWVEKLRANFQLDSSRVIDQASLKEWSTGVFDRTFNATSALSYLTLGLAALALLTSLLTLSQARLPQLAPLWAMGLSPAQLAGLNLLQLLLLALLTALLALPLGLLLAWSLVSVVNVQAFGWRLPLHIFPVQLGISVAMALLAALLAAAWPSWQLRSRASARLVKVFAHER